MPCPLPCHRFLTASFHCLEAAFTPPVTACFRFQELADRLEQTYGEDPMRNWEAQSVLPLLPGPPELFESLRVQMATAGAAVRTKQLRTDRTLVQVSGRRRLLLFPPSSQRALHPYPATHPARGYAQVPGNFSAAAVAAAGSRRFPLLGAHGGAAPRVVLLRPGDAVLVPSGWWMREEMSTHSVGLVVVSTDRAREQAEQELWALPVPVIEEGWAAFDVHTVLAEYMATVIRHVVTDGAVEPAAAAGRWLSELVLSRYAPLFDRFPGLLRCRHCTLVLWTHLYLIEPTCEIPRPSALTWCCLQRSAVNPGPALAALGPTAGGGGGAGEVPRAEERDEDEDEDERLCAAQVDSSCGVDPLRAVRLREVAGRVGAAVGRLPGRPQQVRARRWA